MVIPYTLRKANDFVQLHHRHNGRTARDGGKFAIALQEQNEIVGVAIVGNPLSATYMDGLTAEVLRVCLCDKAPRNSNSVLYGACRRVWFAMGGRRILTYTLTTESGASLRGAGWELKAEIKGHDPSTWGKQDHLQTRKHQDIIKLRKYRWESLNESKDKTMNDKTNNWQDEPKAPRYDSFPLVSEFPREDMRRAIELMEEDIAHQEIEHDLKESRKAVKEELGLIVERNTSKGGMRWGQLVVYDRGIHTRRTLNAKLLVENGVPADVVEKSKKESKPYRDLRVKDLSKPLSTSHGWDEEGD